MSTLILIALTTTLLIIGVYSLFKARRTYQMQQGLRKRLDNVPSELRQLQAQMQALIGLNKALELPWSLPPLVGYAASPDFLLLLAEHALQNKPGVIVECGSGASTIVLAECVRLNGAGHVFSLEHKSEFAESTRRELEKQGLSKWATVVDAPLKNYIFNGQNYRWYAVDPDLDISSIDMLVIDGPPQDTNPCARYPAGPLLFKRLNEASRAFLDDAGRPDEQQTIQLWLGEFPNLQVITHRCERGAVSLIYSKSTRG